MANKEQLSAMVEARLYEYIETRASRLHQGNAYAVRAIVDFWLRCGAPPLSALDEKLDPLPPPLEILPDAPLLLLAEDQSIHGADSKNHAKLMAALQAEVLKKPKAGATYPDRKRKPGER